MLRTLGPVALTAILASTAAAQSWDPLGNSAAGNGVSGGLVVRYSMAMDSAGRPYLVWTDSQIRMRRWDGSTWAEVGGSATVGISGITSGSVDVPVVVLDALDRPIVAWTYFDLAYTVQIHLKKWDGAAWVELGGSASGGGVTNSAPISVYYGYHPSLALDAAGNPHVAWAFHPNAGYPEIHLRRWNGASWVDLGGSATGGGISQTTGFSHAPTVRIDGLGHPVVQWTEGSGSAYDRQIYLKRWNGNAWVELAGSASGAGLSQAPGDATLGAMALDAAGNPIVVWSDNRRDFWTPDIYVRRWNGAAWAGLGGSDGGNGISNGAASGHAKVSVDAAGRVVVAWQEEEIAGADICLRRWTGSAWEELGVSGVAINDAAGATIPMLGLGSGGNPCVAWREATFLYLKAWNPGPPPGPGPLPSIQPAPPIDAGGGGSGQRCAAAASLGGSLAAIVLLLFLIRRA